MSEIEYFGGRLKELREGKGFTQTQLAESAGLTLDGLSRLERGNRRPSWETVLALAAALGVDCTAFTQPPAEREPSGPGRPKKPEAEPAPVEEKPKPKGKRGKK